MKIGLKHNNQQNNGLLSNLLKTVGIFGHQCSVNPQRSKQYYIELLEMKFGELAYNILSQSESRSVQKYLIQVIGVLVHPLYGDILVLPWKRQQVESVRELSENLPLFTNLKVNLIQGMEKIKEKGLTIFLDLLKVEDD